MWRPPLGVPSSSKRSAGALGGVGQVRAGQVGRAAEHLGQWAREGLERELAGLARGHRLGLGLRGRPSRRPRSGKASGRSPAVRRTKSAASSGCAACRRPASPASAASALGAARLGVPQPRRPLRARRTARASSRAPPRGADLVFTQRLAMRLGGAGAVGRAIADAWCGQMISVGSPAAELGLREARRRRRRRRGRRSVAKHVPAIGLEALGAVVGEPGLDARHRC